MYFQYDNYDNAYGIKSIKEVAEILLNHLQKIGQHDSLALISYNVFQYRELKGKIKYNNLDCSNVIKILAEDDKIVNMLKVINSKLNITIPSGLKRYGLLVILINAKLLCT